MECPSDFASEEVAGTRTEMGEDSKASHTRALRKHYGSIDFNS